jgi:hypothetical protein
MPRADALPAQQAPPAGVHAPLLSAGGDTSVDRSIDVSSGLGESRALKAQLSARGLSTKGSKSELKARLAAADGGDSNSQSSVESTNARANYDAQFIEWLSALGLEMYAGVLRDAGCDTLLALSTMREADFARLVTLTTMKRPHARVFKSAFHELRGDGSRPAPGHSLASDANAPLTGALPVPAVVMATGIGPVSEFNAPEVVVPMAPVVAAVAVEACDCTPRCKSQVVHVRLRERARHYGVNVQQQRAADKNKRGTERQMVSLFVFLGYVGWYSSQCDVYCSECTDPTFQTCPGLEGCPAPTQTCDGCTPMVDGHCPPELQPPTSNDGNMVTSPLMCLVQSPGMTAAVIFVGGFMNVSSSALKSYM